MVGRVVNHNQDGCALENSSVGDGCNVPGLIKRPFIGRCHLPSAQVAFSSELDQCPCERAAELAVFGASDSAHLVTLRERNPGAARWMTR